MVHVIRIVLLRFVILLYMSIARHYDDHTRAIANTRRLCCHAMRRLLLSLFVKVLVIVVGDLSLLPKGGTRHEERYWLTTYAVVGYVVCYYAADAVINGVYYRRR